MLSWLLFLATPACGPSAPLSLPQVAPPSPNSQAPAAAETDPAADLLEKLIEAQATEKDLPAVEGFGVSMDIRLYLPEGGNDFKLSLYFKTEPFESIRLLLDDATHGTKVQKGFDKDGFWLLDADQKLISLDAHEFEQDREAIDEAMVLCNDFLLLFDLKRLKRKASELELVKTEAGQTIKGKLRRGRDKWGFELLVGKDKDLPSRLSLQPPAIKVDEEGKELEEPVIPPRLHYEFGDWTSYEGRRLPSWIDEFHGEDLERPLRVMEIEEFLWREAQKLRTARKKDED